MKRTCKTCDAWQPNDAHVVKDGSPQQGWCKALPPACFQLMVQMPGNALRQQAAQLTPAYQAAFPPVDAANWCRSWQRKGTIDDRTADGLSTVPTVAAA